jgi:LacI family gluconate utilization system Gnt-I transcriptional repressor
MDSITDKIGGAVPAMPATLAEVAERAGVSPITVSRVVRVPGLVAAATRERVERAMRELGYVPNLVAGSLASSKTRSVGVLVPTIANAIFADTVQGLSDVLEPQGYSVILAQSRYDPAREEKALSALLSRRPEALIMVGSPATESGAAMLRRARIPVVETWELPAKPIDAAAGFDNAAAGAAVARHYAGSGRSSLAFIGADDPRATSRWIGYRDATVAAGLREPRRLILGRGTVAGGTTLAQLDGVDAVFAANDVHAIGLLAALRDQGRTRPGGPEDQPMAVTGLGDLAMGSLVSPKLSTVRVHGAAIGREAAILTLNENLPRRVDLGFELVLRESA